MSFTRNTYMTALLAFAFLFVAGTAANAAMDESASNTITGEITAIDHNHQTITMSSSDLGSDQLVIRFDDSTQLVRCDNGSLNPLSGNNEVSALSGGFSGLKVGERVTVSLLDIGGRFYAESISPSGSDVMRC